MKVEASDTAPGRSWAHERKRPVALRVLTAVVGEVRDALSGAGVSYGFHGGIASGIWGRARLTRDVDLIVAPDDASAVLRMLSARGFETDCTYPSWCLKAYRDGVVVDVIFQVYDVISFDRQMANHVVRKCYRGLWIPVISAEDLLMIKARCHEVKLRRQDQVNAHRHWRDAVGIIARTPLDWTYVLERSRLGGRMLLSLLIYAHGLDLDVPEEVCMSLARKVYRL